MRLQLASPVRFELRVLTSPPTRLRRSRGPNPIREHLRNSRKTVSPIRVYVCPSVFKSVKTLINNGFLSAG